MSKLEFRFDRERDALNFWELCNSECSWKDEKTDLDLNYLNLFKEKSFSDSKKKILKMLNKLHNSHYIEIFRDSLQKSWEQINDEYFDRLEKLTNNSISSENFTAYITSVGRCAYKKNNTFTVSLKRPLLQAVRTCGHELLHLHIDNLYGKNLRESIGEDRFNFLNESLTVLLNLEFKNLWQAKDIGYFQNKNLREFIEKEWKEKKDFGVLMEKCVEYLK